MVNLTPFATALRKTWNRIMSTADPDFAVMAGALINPLTGAAVATVNTTTGAVAFANGVTPNVQVLTADGAITIKQGIVILNKSSAIAATLAAPTATTDDGKILWIESITAQAHTVTQTTPGFNNGSTASDVATFGTAIANGFEILAYQGVWYVLGTAKGVSLG